MRCNGGGAGVANFYETKVWKRKRERIMRRDKYLCQYSKRYGKLIPAQTVHHILPFDEYPEYGLADWNLIALSHEAHNKMHARHTKDLSVAGKELAKRTLMKYGITLEVREDEG